MRKIKLLIAESSFLIRQGLRSAIERVPDLDVAGEALKPEDLSDKLAQLRPDILIINYTSRHYCLDDLKMIREYFPWVRIIAITDRYNKEVFRVAVGAGADSHLLRDAGREEIIATIRKTANGEKYYCREIREALKVTDLG